MILGGEAACGGARPLELERIAKIAIEWQLLSAAARLD
jgi:hypothetical protein